MFEDPFKDTANSLSSPAADCFEIEPDNSFDLASATKAIYIGTGGDIVIQPVGSTSDVTFVNVPSGAILPIRVQAVRINGTTASDIVGLV
ncbi:MAG: hypothetical protein AAGL10_15250 [Pseudomonadota bacterium]